MLLYSFRLSVSGVIRGVVHEKCIQAITPQVEFQAMNVWDYLMEGYKVVVKKATLTLSVKDNNAPNTIRLAILEASVVLEMNELKDGTREFVMYVDIPGSILIETHELPSSSAKFVCDEINKWIKEHGADFVSVEEGVMVTVENEDHEPVHIGYDSYISNNVATGYNKPFVRYLT